LPVTAGRVGMALGVQDVVVLDSGKIVAYRGPTGGRKGGNPRFVVQDAQRLAQAQRRWSKTHRGSKNRDQARRKVARVHRRSADRRRAFPHNLSTRLLRENQTICVERLRVQAMVKHPRRAKALPEVGWGELVRQLEYTAAWYGRTWVKIARCYPSSKR